MPGSKSIQTTHQTTILYISSFLYFWMGDKTIKDSQINGEKKVATSLRNKFYIMP
jgi:hypothetical protein